MLSLHSPFGTLSQSLPFSRSSRSTTARQPILLRTFDVRWTVGLTTQPLFSLNRPFSDFSLTLYSFTPFNSNLLISFKPTFLLFSSVPVVPLLSETVPSSLRNCPVFSLVTRLCSDPSQTVPPRKTYNFSMYV